ncbi:MAG: arginine deiminase family protein [Acidobacteriota bacterium]|nr:arginine deiminase family protein [Acidobacteriota bacterium]
MHQLLFDDILFGREARAEHDDFSRVLSKAVDRVFDAQDLLAETFQQDGVASFFLNRYCRYHHLGDADREILESLPPDELAKRAVNGWYEENADGTNYTFRFPPVPNLLFMRDPAAVIGKGVSINNMATSARKPEPMIMESIFRFHPDFKVDSDENIWFDRIPGFMNGRPQTYHTLEGGDILVLSEDVVAIGISIRTSQSAVTLIAEALRQRSQFKTLLAVLMPQERAVMHLDTIFTQIDEEHCLIFPPLFQPESPRSVPVIKMDLTSDQLKVVLEDNFLEALEKEGHGLKPILSGGRNLLDQEREQWTDGANAFCIAPGVILGYERNVLTAETLGCNGYNVVTSQQVLNDEVDLLDGKRYFILIKGNELSRARGGPRCMTMPLKRDSLDS